MTDYDGAAQTALDKVQQVIGEGPSDGWTLFSDAGGVKLEQKSYDYCPINCFRATCLLDASPEDAIQLLWDMSLADFQQIDSGIADVSAKFVRSDF
jgi:hypothetical protein